MIPALLMNTSIGPSSRLDIVGEALDRAAVGHVELEGDGPGADLLRGAAGGLDVEVAEGDAGMPWRTKAYAIARPMPRAPPVIAAT